jgi:hypothetical protein
MIWCRAVKQWLCTVKLVFFSMKYIFFNFQSSTATGSSDVYSISKVNIVQYILISQIEFGLAHDSRSSDKRLQEVSGFNLN